MVAAAFDQEARFDADMFVSRLPTDRLSQRSSRPVTLIELDLPDGVLRISARGLTAAGFGWAGLLQSAPAVTRALGESVDDMLLTVLDDGVSSRFTDANPPEGSEVRVFILDLDDPRESLIPIFTGRIEEVTSVGGGIVALEIVRADAVLDQVIGRLADLTIFPNAPSEALGKMIPILYGQPVEVEALVTQFNEVGQLLEPMDELQTTVRLRSTGGFPRPSGKVIVDDEVMQYASIASNLLEGLTRGVDGTLAALHPGGTSVAVKGSLIATFADHAVTSILSPVRIMDETGALVVPDQIPTFDPANGRVIWNQTPTIETPSRSIETVLLGMEIVGGSNSASDPLRAARESNEYTDLNFATLTSQEVLHIIRQTPEGELGTITRVGLVVVCDPSEGINGSQVTIDGGIVGTLVDADTTPNWAVRRIERQMKASYEVRDPTHFHSAGSRTVIVRPRTALNRNLADNLADPSRAWFHPTRGINGDTNDSTWTNANKSEAFIARDADLNIASDEAISSGFFRAWGGPPFPEDGVAKTGRMTVGFNVPATFGLTTFNTQLRVDFPTAWSLFSRESPVVPGGDFPSPSAFPSALWVAQPIDPLVDGAGKETGVRFQVRNMELVLQVAKVVQPSPTGVTQRRSVTNFFDVTARSGGNWDYFTGRDVRVQNKTSAETLRINAIYWAVEYRPTLRTAIRVPRVFAGARGLVPLGEPTEIIRDVLTRATPRGMGLAASVPVQGTYARVRQSLSGDGIVQGFALYAQTSALALVAKIAEQADIRQWWDAGFHFVSRKPDPSNLDEAFRRFSTEDVRRGSLARRRQQIGEVFNRVEIRSLFVPSVPGLVRVSTVEDAGYAGSQALFGRRLLALDFGLIASKAVAGTLAAKILERKRLPRWRVSFMLPLFGLELRRGDLVELQHNQFVFAKGEVLSLPIRLAGEKLVEVICIVWEV